MWDRDQGQETRHEHRKYPLMKPLGKLPVATILLTRYQKLPPAGITDGINAPIGN